MQESQASLTMRVNWNARCNGWSQSEATLRVENARQIEKNDKLLKRSGYTFLLRRNCLESESLWC